MKINRLLSPFLDFGKLYVATALDWDLESGKLQNKVLFKFLNSISSLGPLTSIISLQFQYKPMSVGSLGYSTENTPSKKTSLRWGDACFGTKGGLFSHLWLELKDRSQPTKSFYFVKPLFENIFRHIVLVSSRFKFQLDLITTNEAFIGNSEVVVYCLVVDGKPANRQAKNSDSAK
jgi:hypothetical protein